MIADGTVCHHPGGVQTFRAFLAEGHFIDRNPSVTGLSAGEHQLDMLHTGYIQSVQCTDLHLVRSGGIGQVSIITGDSSDLGIFRSVCTGIKVEIVNIIEGQFQLLKIHCLFQGIDDARLAGIAALGFRIPEGLFICIVRLEAVPVGGGILFPVVVPAADELGCVDPGMLALRLCPQHPGNILAGLAAFTEAHIVEGYPSAAVLSAGKYQLDVLDIFQLQAVQGADILVTLSLIGLVCIGPGDIRDLGIVLAIFADIQIKVVRIGAEGKLHLVQIHLLFQRELNAGLACVLCLGFRIPEGVHILVVSLIARPGEILFSVVFPLADQLGRLNPGMGADGLGAHHPVGIQSLCAFLKGEHFV